MHGGGMHGGGMHAMGGGMRFSVMGGGPRFGGAGFAGRCGAFGAPLAGGRRARAGAAFLAATIASISLNAWWPLVAGFALAWLFKLLQKDAPSS